MTNDNAADHGGFAQAVTDPASIPNSFERPFHLITMPKVVIARVSFVFRIFRPAGETDQIAAAAFLEAILQTARPSLDRTPRPSVRFPVSLPQCEWLEHTLDSILHRSWRASEFGNSSDPFNPGL